jgi:glutathione S-transferase
MRVYQHPASGNCMKVRMLAHVLGLELEYVDVDIFAGEALQEPHLSRNPAGATPVLELPDGSFLAESGAILVWLATGTPLLPEERDQRAQVVRWLLFEQNAIEPTIAAARFRLLCGWATPDDPVIVDKVKSAASELKVLERQLEGRAFVTGDALTIADLALYAYIHVAGDVGLDLGRRPGVVAWLERVREKTGYTEPLAPIPRLAR